MYVDTLRVCVMYHETWKKWDVWLEAGVVVEEKEERIVV